ncbi:MAG TPA: DNA polymerase III subunit [Actinomycetota bacterium]|nr:DNA polymerase III subunit [Actinomycetota bacterium]
MSDQPGELPPVIRDVPGQEQAVNFLARAIRRPHHAYLYSGPEGSGKRLGMRAFAAALLCPQGGCGKCRACRLALAESHPNMLILEPAGPDILVGKDASDQNTARWFASRAYLTPPEPGRKVMVVLQADRLRVEAADVLLKVVEEPPLDTVFILLSARPDDLPDTIRSRCQEIGFPPLSEEFVVATLRDEGMDPERARLACRLAGGNLGRARRLARDERQLAFRRAALEAARLATRGSAGALTAAEGVTAAAKEFRAGLAEELESELQPFLDERGRPEEPFRGVVRRLEEQHERRLRRSEREFLDWSLLFLAAYWRDVVVAGTGGQVDLLINLDLDLPDSTSPPDQAVAKAGRAWGAVEEARADLADETNLNARLVLERLFLRIAELRPLLPERHQSGLAGPAVTS